jgi:hypothetical protein
MTLKEILEVGAAVITSLGGGGAIVFALSGYLGKRWADDALAKQKQDYAQLNIAFTQQLDLATRRVQIELDALGHLHKLRTQSEFQRISELWKSIALVERFFHGLAKPEDSSKPSKSAWSFEFCKKVMDAQFMWREEMLSIPKHLSQAAGALLIIAGDEQERVFQCPDPFISILDVKARSDFFVQRAKRLSEFVTGINKLEPMMREYLQGTKSPTTQEQHS